MTKTKHDRVGQNKTKQNNMNKKQINEGLNQDSTFNKIKAAFTKPTQEQILKEEQKWTEDSEKFRKEEIADEMLSEIAASLKGQPQLKPLTEEEMMILPILIKYLRKRTNDMIHITADEIIRDFNNHKQRLGMKNNLNIPRLMKLTAYIRYNELAALVSGSSGYFISNDPYVILACYYSLSSRANAIIAAAIGMKNMATNMIVVNSNQQQNPDPFGFEFD